MLPTAVAVGSLLGTLCFKKPWQNFPTGKKKKIKKEKKKKNSLQCCLHGGPLRTLPILYVFCGRELPFIYLLQKNPNLLETHAEYSRNIVISLLRFTFEH